MEESWKQLIYQGNEYLNFEVSNQGNLRNAHTKKIYKQWINKQGYYQICVSLGSKNNKKTFKMHKAVAETFVDNPENKPVPNHKDGNKLNNNVHNLEWVTHSENSKHAFENGLIQPHIGVNNPSAKLSKEQVIYIRNNCIPNNKEFGCRAMAKKFNVSHQRISDIINNKTYKDI